MGPHTLTLEQAIPPGHKFALVPIAKDEEVKKFQVIIGHADEAITIGQHVHDHNISCRPFDRAAELATAVPTTVMAEKQHTFEGYLRPDGRVGTRNYIAILSTVNCSATVAQRVADFFTPDRLVDYPNVDGVFAATHHTGCGLAANGTDHEHLSRVLAGYAEHPNVAAYVLIGLGCEVNQASELVQIQELESDSKPKPRMTSIQAVGGVQNAIRWGISQVEEILPQADQCRRTTQSAKHLVLGLECGGSDGYSGITANPAVGVCSDLLVAQGATCILGETPEIYGAEQLLTRRAITPEVGQKLLDRLRWWEWYTSVFKAEINNNPSSGNKRGGLSTIYEKSLGAVAKGGSSAMVDVVHYAESVPTANGPGLVVMDTPGYDPVSVTGMVAGGANLVVFTTGRGSCFGCLPTPSLKVATNTPVFKAMPDDMDLNAGDILTGASVEEVGKRIYDELLQIASGKPTKSEVQGIGSLEFLPWTLGPVL